MANINAATGFSPLKSIISGKWNQGGNIYHIPSTDNNQYGLGDVVLSASTGSDANGIPDVTLAAATDIARGVIVGILPANVNSPSLQGTTLALETIPIPATKTRDYYVLVDDDPNTVFVCQCDNTATLVAGSTIGYNAKMVVAAPSGISPFSGTQIDHTNIATTNTFMWKILGLYQTPGSDFTAYAKLLVKFNTHEFFGSTSGV